MAASSASPGPGLFGKLINTLGAIVQVILTVIRRMPILVAFVVIATVVAYRQSQQPEEQFPEFRGPEEMLSEPQPPSDLPPGTNPSLWTCVHRVDSQLSNGLWAEVYFGLEVQLDGKVVTVKVTEKWQELSDEKRKTVAQLVVDTWLDNGKALQLLTSEQDLEKIVIKRLPEDETVATWQPTTGIQLSTPQVGAWIKG